MPTCAQRLRPADGVQVLPSRAGPGCLVAGALVAGSGDSWPLQVLVALAGPATS